MIEIRHINGTVLYTAQNATDIRSAVEEAVKARANLARADLARANLARADLAGANLAGANLAGAYLAGADLAGAYLARANLARANLARADLAGANLAGANLAGADLAGADLAGAYLAGAYLADASTGMLLGYGWSCLDGVLSYGCERHPLPEWTTEKIAELARKHELSREALFVAGTTALVTMLRDVARAQENTEGKGEA